MTGRGAVRRELRRRRVRGLFLVLLAAALATLLVTAWLALREPPAPQAVAPAAPDVLRV